MLLYLQIRLSATHSDMCGFITDSANCTEFWNIEEFDYGEAINEMSNLIRFDC